MGERKKYYQDNGEDAIIMTTEGFETPAFQERLAARAAELEARWPGCIAAARAAMGIADAENGPAA